MMMEFFHPALLGYIISLISSFSIFSYSSLLVSFESDDTSMLINLLSKFSVTAYIFLSIRIGDDTKYDAVTYLLNNENSKCNEIICNVKQQFIFLFFFFFFFYFCFFFFFCFFFLFFFFFFFFFNDTATTEIYTLSLHDALPIRSRGSTRASEEVVEHGLPLTQPRRALARL